MRDTTSTATDDVTRKSNGTQNGTSRPHRLASGREHDRGLTGEHAERLATEKSLTHVEQLGSRRFASKIVVSGRVGRGSVISSSSAGNLPRG